MQLKASSMYVETYIEKSDWINMRISIFTALVSSGSVGAWAIWKHLDWLWAGLVAASQVLNVVKQHLPFTKRLASLKPLSFACQQLCNKAESNWHPISQAEMTESEINDLITELNSESLKAWNKAIGDVVLPVNKRIRRVADQKTAEYFSQAYGMPATIEK